MVEYIAGNTIKQSATLYTNKSLDDVMVIPVSSILIAYIADKKRNKVVVQPVQILSTDDGNDWQNGVVTAVFKSSDTASLRQYDGDTLWIAIRVQHSSSYTTFKQQIKAVKMPIIVV